MTVIQSAAAGGGDRDAAAAEATGGGGAVPRPQPSGARGQEVNNFKL